VEAKMLTYLHKLVSVVLLGAVFITTVYPQTPSEQIIGKWKDQEEGVVTEYFSDGTMTIKITGTGTFKGKWAIKGNELILQFRIADQSMTQSGKLTFPSSDVMEIADKESTSRSVRIK